MKRVLALCVTILFTLTIAYAGGELRYSESFLSDSRGHLTNITTVKSMNEILDVYKRQIRTSEGVSKRGGSVFP